MAVDAGVDIDGDRKENVVLDPYIINSIRRRCDLSTRIQRQRMSEGGTRTVLSRENVILDRYTAGLGAGGAALALNILGLCRGGMAGPGAGDDARAGS
ncbi:chorismate mutase [Streptomyces sp. NPDC002276]